MSISSSTAIDERLPFQLYSDLHLELIEDPFGFPRFERHKDVLVLAGDIGHISSATFRNFMNYCSLLWDHVVFVPGNREFYSESKTYAHLYSEYVKYFNEFSNVYFLNCDALEFGHFFSSRIAVRSTNDFVLFGATMWSPIQPKWDDGRQRIQGFDQPSESWEHMLALRTFLERHRTDHSKKMYVVTHFPIVRDPERVVSEEYVTQPADKMRYFMCGWLNCFPLVWTRKISAVCSGHTHHPFDFVFKDVRNVSNPRGFPSEAVVAGFKPDGVF
jgi:hypothetical protein